MILRELKQCTIRSSATPVDRAAFSDARLRLVRNGTDDALPFDPAGGDGLTRQVGNRRRRRRS
jgi:hypothetical protein